MEYVGKLGNLFTTVQTFYNEINPATLSGAIDIVVVEQDDGELACSPFHVRFGKLSLFMPQEKRVEIKVNGKVVPYVMKVGEEGEAFFVFETEHEVPEEFQTSPIVSAVSENKSSEEPPYLDISESRSLDHDPATATGDTDLQSDNFEDDVEKGVDNRLTLPAQLQSPKMIIEEQMDKVVTKMDPYQASESPEYDSDMHDQEISTTLETSASRLSLYDEPADVDVAPKHDIYPMSDGSTLLERIIPEAITTTTVAKETFIVRPANSDIYNTLMDVTHTSIHRRSTVDEHNETQPNEKVGEPSYTHAHGRGETETIVLDIAGYKTEEGRWEQTSAQKEQHDFNEDHQTVQSSPTSSNQSNELGLEPESEPNVHSNTTNESAADADEQLQSQSSWGWGMLRNRDTSDTNSAEIPSDDEGGVKATVNEGPIHLEQGTTYRIEMSLCGFSGLGHASDENDRVFAEHQITYDKFVHNPNVLNNRRLVFRYNGQYYSAGRTGPLFTSLFLFQKPLEDAGRLQQDTDEASSKMSDSRESYQFGRGWRLWLNRSSVAAPTLESDRTATYGQEEGAENDKSNETTTFTTTTMATSVGWSEDHHVDVEGSTESQHPYTPRRYYARTLRLTSEQLRSLRLNKGVNTVTFSVTSAYQGTATCAAKIFYWDHDIQVVISDIDGTITKSDTLGHVFTMIGKDWTHNGVAKLYTDIRSNGYYILYLTSRAIGQADYTRDYLKKVSQGKYQLPDGPVIMSPDRLFTSLHREVIMRKPEIFKMACLRDIQRLFGDRNPFNAGFGNRITDAMSYRSVNVPASRIFTIDPYGEVKLELLTGFKSSYIHLNDLVEQIFPPINKAINEEYNDWNYWKSPLPKIDIPDVDNTTPSSSSQKGRRKFAWKMM